MAAQPAAWGVTLHSAQLNGIQQRWADTGEAPSGATGSRGPVVLFLHGWPESWFSWRHQLKAMGAAGYRGVAPDMRGYGGTSAPADAAEYNVYRLAGDMLSLLQHLGVTRAALVGHDHGAMLGWKLAQLHPEVFPCYFAMSVPYGGRTQTPYLATMRSAFGDEGQPEADPSFFYMLHHNMPTAAADYAQDTRAVFRTLFGDAADAAPAPVQSRKLYVDGKPEPFWRRMPQPKALASWITEEEVAYFVDEFERKGWDGGLNWYRVLDIDWHATPQLAGRRIRQPVAFLAGSADSVLTMFGGPDKIPEVLSRVCTPWCVKMIDGAGHWIQQERPREVNEVLLAFLGEHRSSFLPGPPPGPPSRL